jgi:hypothetical protein
MSPEFRSAEFRGGEVVGGLKIVYRAAHSGSPGFLIDVMKWPVKIGVFGNLRD